MPHAYPPDLAQFVRREMAKGDYETENDLVVDALRVLRELKTRHQHLRAELQVAIAQADRGEVVPLDTDATKKEGRRRLSEQE
ncbi:MAG: type II toxin-antitoxin system ParD family antitoxin [Planctomycetaceae bacterium]